VTKIDEICYYVEMSFMFCCCFQLQRRTRFKSLKQELETLRDQRLSIEEVSGFFSYFLLKIGVFMIWVRFHFAGTCEESGVA